MTHPIANRMCLKIIKRKVICNEADSGLFKAKQRRNASNSLIISVKL